MGIGGQKRLKRSNKQRSTYDVFGDVITIAYATICRKARRGMWKHGDLAETPAQYKARYAGGASPDPTTKVKNEKTTQPEPGRKKGRSKWLWG